MNERRGNPTPGFPPDPSAAGSADGPSRSRARLAFLLASLIPLFSLEARPPAGALLSGGPGGAEETLALARARARESGLGPGETGRFLTVESQGGLWTLRARAARAAALLSGVSRREAAPLAEGLETARLGLPGLSSWIQLSSSLTPREVRRPALGKSGEVPALVDLAGRVAEGSIRRAALTEASRRARTPSDRRLVREAVERHLPAGPAGPVGPRAAVQRALALLRVAEGRTEKAAIVAALLASHPDGPEEAATYLDEADRRLVLDASLDAPLEVRLARALALAPRRADEASRILGRPAGSAEQRLVAAEVLLAVSRLKEAERELASLRSTSLAQDVAARVEALALRVRMRLLSARSQRTSLVSSPRRRGKARVRILRRVVATDVDRAALSTLLSDADRIGSGGLPAADRRLVLSDAVRVAARLGLLAEAQRRLPALVALDPGTTAAAEELFADARDQLRRGEAADAARRLSDQAALYRAVWVRRRAAYWAGRAHQRAGAEEAGKTLLASLVAGAVPDVYARWAAEGLGVPRPSAVVPEWREETPSAALGATLPGPASRELLACGFPLLAEDAAEEEASLDVLFAAAVASERGDHRRAVGLLKSRHPELGTPDEGVVPLAVRRAFYPVAHLPLFDREAGARGVPMPLVLALVRQESIFSPAVKSRAGAVGLMQVMPATGRLVARRQGKRGHPDLSDPEENVGLGTAFFAGLLARYDGDVVSALAAYNAGPGRVDRWRRARPGTPEDEFLESIPIPETRDYVRRVLFYREAYRALLPLSSQPSMAAFPVSPAP